MWTCRTSVGYSHSWGKMLLHLKCILLIAPKGPMCSRGFFLSGTFGKPLRRPHLDAFSSSGQSSDCQPRTFHLKACSSPNLDCESEEDGKERTDFQRENHTCTYKQTLETTGLQIFSLMTWTHRLNGTKEEF